MPQALVDKIVRSETFNQGYTTVEYLGSAIVDMDLHTTTGGTVDAGAFERDTLARIGMPRARSPCDTVCPSSRTCSRVMHTGRVLQLSVVGGDGRGHLEGVSRGGRSMGQGCCEATARASSRMAIRSIESKPIACSAVAIRM